MVGSLGLKGKAIGERAKRHKATKLEQHDKLRRVVEAKLKEFWSPEQISAWLRTTHPDDTSMQVSREAIDLGLFAGVVADEPWTPSTLL